MKLSVHRLCEILHKCNTTNTTDINTPLLKVEYAHRVLAQRDYLYLAPARWSCTDIYHSKDVGIAEVREGDRTAVTGGYCGNDT